MDKMWYSMDSNSHLGDVWYDKSRKIEGFFKVNCGVADGDLRRLKKILKALWLIYVILQKIGKVSNRFYKFSFLCRSVEEAANEKQDGDKMSLSKIADDHI